MSNSNSIFRDHQMQRKRYYRINPHSALMFKADNFLWNHTEHLKWHFSQSTEQTDENKVGCLLFGKQMLSFLLLTAHFIDQNPTLSKGANQFEHCVLWLSAVEGKGNFQMFRDTSLAWFIAKIARVIFNIWSFTNLSSLFNVLAFFNLVNLKVPSKVSAIIWFHWARIVKANISKTLHCGFPQFRLKMRFYTSLK